VNRMKLLGFGVRPLVICGAPGTTLSHIGKHFVAWITDSIVNYSISVVRWSWTLNLEFDVIAWDFTDLAPYAGPGQWNDPDMLEVGVWGMSDVASKAHFSLWSILAAPLIMGQDLRNMTSTTLEILSNAEGKI